MLINDDLWMFPLKERGRTMYNMRGPTVGSQKHIIQIYPVLSGPRAVTPNRSTVAKGHVS
jgi:hypothetical protein